MAINRNHEFEELNGIKCAIVEKNASKERINFLKPLLEFNKYTVVVVPSAVPKAAPSKPGTDAEESSQADASTEPPLPPATFTIGVTDVSFNPVNAIFGRMLKTAGGKIVTLAYWQQKEEVPNDEVPYFANR